MFGWDYNLTCRVGYRVVGSVTASVPVETGHNTYQLI